MLVSQAHIFPAYLQQLTSEFHTLVPGLKKIIHKTGLKIAYIFYKSDFTCAMYHPEIFILSI